MKRLIMAVAAVVLVAEAASPAGQRQSLVAAVRAAIAAQDFAGGEQVVSLHRSANGETPELLEALSWLGRGALAANQLTAAEKYASETYRLASDQLRTRALDQEPHLPTALGAAVEVLGHVMARQGARTEAVEFLRRELEVRRGTSIEKRVQKNLHLLSLEGKPAPPIDVTDHLGPNPATIQQLEGDVVLLFFWAHWCADCKAQAPVLERLAAKYGNQGLRIVGPTQRFGYVAGGKPATLEEESRYIQQVRDQSYPALSDASVPLSASNHVRYGVSSTPTLVLIDRDGMVALYHPGRIPEPQLDALVGRLVSRQVP